MASQNPVSPPSRVSPDVVTRVTAEAKRDGFFAGLTGALASAVLGARVFGFSKNKTILCGVLTGVLSGYMFTQAFTSTALAQLRAEEARLKTSTGNLPNDAEFLADD